MIVLIQFLRRAFQVFWICLRHISGITLDRLLKRPGVPGPERLRALLEDLSGSFLKFGQILSLQVDALPREYCDALLNLLDRVPPFPQDRIRQIFVDQFRQPPEDLFREFDYTPFASASIGQVHHAVQHDSTDEMRLAELSAIGFDSSVFVSNVINNFLMSALSPRTQI